MAKASTIKQLAIPIVTLITGLIIGNQLGYSEGLKWREGLKHKVVQIDDNKEKPEDTNIDDTDENPGNTNVDEAQDDANQKTYRLLYNNIFINKPGSDDYEYQNKANTSSGSGNLAGSLNGFDLQINTNYATVEYPDFFTGLKISRNNKTLFDMKYPGYAPSDSIEIKTPNQITNIVEISTYGATCCASLITITVMKGNVYLGKPLDVQHGDIIEKEHFFVKSGHLYKIVFDDRFVDYYMSFSDSMWMLFPQIYLIDQRGFTLASDQFREYYSKLYHDADEIIKPIFNKTINWSSDPKNNFQIAMLIYRYTLGTLAGVDRKVLKREIIAPQPDVDLSSVMFSGDNKLIDEEFIYKFLTSPRGPE